MSYQESRQARIDNNAHGQRKCYSLEDVLLATKAPTLN